MKEKFIVTGVERMNGRRFVIGPTDEFHAMCINLWRGSVWEVIDGKRKLVKRVWNV